MFNGIVYNQGIIKSIKKNPKYVQGSLVIEVVCNLSFKKLDIGESVCCDGVCLTLIRIKKKSFLFYLALLTVVSVGSSGKMTLRDLNYGN